jgi:hypothetical protein
MNFAPIKAALVGGGRLADTLAATLPPAQMVKILLRRAVISFAV